MPKPAQNVIGPQIRRLRVQSSLSQEQLAARVGVNGWDISRGTLAKIEARVRCVTDAELFVLAKALKVDMTRLFPRDASEITANIRD